jgi:alcohol dehydrogenase class IV
MKNFNFHQTTELVFGCGRIKELGEIANRYGKKVLLVTTPASSPALTAQYEKVKAILANAGLSVKHFDNVIPNPTVESISEGAELAKKFGAELIVGLGGGSSMDSAKAISVEATHSGTSWDYLFYKQPQPDEAKLLPVIAVSTTSGTGSQVTQVAVITHTENRDKSALYNNILYPKVAVIDPELMVTVPGYVTAATGFDVFCHAFESILNPGNGAYVELMAWEAIEIVINTLPELISDLTNISLREKMSWADTLGGLCIANSGVTLPHGMGMAIGGMYPKVAHGEGLAAVYPAFVAFTKDSATDKFARLARILDKTLQNRTDSEAASKCNALMVGFLDAIGLNKGLKELGVLENEIDALAKQCMVLPDYQSNPRVADESEIKELILMSL